MPNECLEKLFDDLKNFSHNFKNPLLIVGKKSYKELKNQGLIKRLKKEGIKVKKA